MLNECRLKKEEMLLAQDESQCNTISTKEEASKAVGPTLMIQLHIEGVPVEAMVDTGSQSTVISRAVLH
jgi:predicted aspartyl protease